MCSCCLKLWRHLEMPLKIYLYVCKDASNVTLDSKIIPKRYWNNQKSWLLPPEYTFFFFLVLKNHLMRDVMYERLTQQPVHQSVSARLPQHFRTGSPDSQHASHTHSGRRVCSPASQPFTLCLPLGITQTEWHLQWGSFWCFTSAQKITGA